MAPYSYSQLSTENQEIRIISLLPGQYEEPIRIVITHESLDFPKIDRPPRSFTQEEIRSVPDGWTLRETLSGHILYEYDTAIKDEPRSDLGICSWTHPSSDPSFSNEDIYESPTDIRPIYEALSYAWGSTDDLEVAYVSEFSTTRDIIENVFTTMELGKNLICALKHLRNIYAPRRLWVDAICINQTDMKERERQVLRMDNIYKSADRVLIWLGPTKDNSSLAISVLQKIGQRVEITRDGFIVSSPDYREPFSWPPQLPGDEQSWLAINELIQVPWFERLWILQEAQLSSLKSIVICGHNQLSWDLFRRAIVYLYAFQSYSLVKLSQDLRRCLDTVYGICWGLTHGTFPYLLSISRKAKCSLPVDKIYGIVGLAPRNIRTKIKPKYSLCSGEVYKSTFLDHVSLVHRLELLGFSKIQYRIVHMPSWVPNWSLNFKVFNMWWGGGFSAAGVSSAHVHYQPPNLLQVTGVRCATVHTVSNSVMERTSDLYDLVRGKDYQSFQSETYVTGESMLEAYAWTLSFGWLKERYPTHDVSSIQEFKKTVIDEVKMGTKTQDVEITDVCRIAITEHKFLTTKEGYFGFGPNSSLPGDVICTFLGCHIPIVLRQIGEDAYEVVGECYFHGIMDGESILGPLPAPWKIRMTTNIGGIHEITYWNPQTNVTSQEDPRLDSLLPEWERLPQEWTREDPVITAWHKNKVTGEVMNSDPRMLPDALIARGVKLEHFKLL